jgi:hypothetical protein
LPIHDLFDLMRQTSDGMQAEYDRITRRSKEDPGTAGDEGEGNWRQLLMKWLPPQYRVETKGRIIFADGRASPQIDVIVLSPEYPAGLVDKKLYFAGGVLAAFECKLTLRANDIRKAFQTASTLASRLPPRIGTPYLELHRPIVFGVLAHSHDWKREASTPIENVNQQLFRALQEISHPKEMLDMICVSDVGTWTAMRASSFGAYAFHEGMWKWKKEEPPSIHGAYMLHHGSHSREEDPFTNIGAFVCDLYVRLGRERTELRPVAEYFETVGLSGSAQGSGRDWAFTLYSDGVQDRAVEEFHANPPEPESRFPKFKVRDNWSQWSHVFM